MRKFTLKYRWALGDSVVLTALVRDLARAGHTVAVDVRYPEVFANSPYVTQEAGGQVVDLSVQRWRKMTKRGQDIHITQALFNDFVEKTGVKIEPSSLAGDLHFTEAERQPLFDGAYWVVLAGSRSDLTVKQWPPKFYQRVVDELPDVRFVQVGVANDLTFQPQLRNVIDLVGATSVRDLLRVVSQSSGVLSSITGVMHLAAALGKPIVTVGGGIETPAFTQYKEADHEFLHVIGQLGCCSQAGCDRRFATGAGDLACKNQRFDGPVPTPLCMQLVSPFLAAAAVRKKHAGGVKAERSTLTPVRRISVPVAAQTVPRPAMAAAVHMPVLPSIQTAIWVDPKRSKQLVHLTKAVPDAIVFSSEETTKAEAVRKLGKICDVVAWFDASATIVRRNWKEMLSESWKINARKCKLYGRRLRYNVYEDAGAEGLAWFSSAAWHRGTPLFVPGRDTTAPNGVEIETVDPGFWAADAEAIAAIALDDRIQSVGFEIVLAEQFRQAGWRIKSFSDNGSPVYLPPRPLELDHAPWRRRAA